MYHGGIYQQPLDADPQMQTLLEEDPPEANPPMEADDPQDAGPLLVM